jgi:hypothetical protein
MDLAAKVGTDLIRNLTDESGASERAAAFRKEVPRLLSRAGYSLGLAEHLIDISHILETHETGALDISDPEIREVLGAAYLSLNVSRGNFDVLRNILTFDPRTWTLVLKLIQHYGIDACALSAHIESCRDPFQFRLLCRLCGDLRMAECAEAICSRFLATPSMSRAFEESQAQATNLRTVVRDSLAAMPNSVLAVVESYADRARALKRWREKQVFQAAATSLRDKSEATR